MDKVSEEDNSDTEADEAMFAGLSTMEGFALSSRTVTTMVCLRWLGSILHEQQCSFPDVSIKLIVLLPILRLAIVSNTSWKQVTVEVKIYCFKNEAHLEKAF